MSNSHDWNIDSVINCICVVYDIGTLDERTRYKITVDGATFSSIVMNKAATTKWYALIKPSIIYLSALALAHIGIRYCCNCRQYNSFDILLILTFYTVKCKTSLWQPQLPNVQVENSDCKINGTEWTEQNKTKHTKPERRMCALASKQASIWELIGHNKNQNKVYLERTLAHAQRTLSKTNSVQQKLLCDDTLTISVRAKIHVWPVLRIRVYACARMRARKHYESLAITTINVEEAKKWRRQQRRRRRRRRQRRRKKCWFQPTTKKRLSNCEQYESIDYIKEASTRLSFSVVFFLSFVVVKQQANKHP